MDWAVDATDAAALRDARVEVMAFLKRHAAEPFEPADIELVVAELLSNVWRHAHGPVWINISWSESQPILRVADLGPGFDLTIGLPPVESVGGRGLYIVHQMVDRLDVLRRDGGGSDVSVRLPVLRPVEISIDPPRRRVAALPAVDQALPTGGFGREAFLHALVVQLAHVAADHAGPDMAERVIAQVGADVGGQMEIEYRRASGLTGRLSAAQLADCFVRLKHAIDGRFSIVEITEHRIVLENSQCPFGLAVRQSPGLCRMTSSVFGGIAARNAGHQADVILEERIAIGDARCRVIIELDPAASVPHAHKYRSPA